MKIRDEDWQLKATPLTVWFSSWRGGDWLCTLYRLPDGNGRIEYRYRYDVEGSEDERRWYEVNPKLRGEPGVEELRVLTREIAHLGAPSPPEEVEVVGGDILEALRDKPWFHVLPTAAGEGEA